MLGKIIEKINAHIVAYRLKQVPAIRIGRTSIMQYWKENPEVIRNFTKEVVDSAAANMMEDVIRVATSPDPRMANRKALADCVCEYAAWQVLIIEPPPTPDVTGLRGKPGITGELKAHLAELAEKDKHLQESLYEIDGPIDRNDLQSIMVHRNRVLWTWTQVYSQIRTVFDDLNRVKGKDWVEPFIAAMCAWHEYLYRALLGMPQVLGNSEVDTFIHASSLSRFLDIVMSGVQYPDLEWQRQKPNGA